MRRSFRHLQMLGLVAMVSTLQACSFSSTQLDLLSLAWNREPDLIPYEQLAWTMIWSGTDYRLIPVFPPNESITNFMDNSGVLVSFDGWQVTRAEGVLPRELKIRIVKTDTGLEYVNEGEVIAEHACTEFASSLEGSTTIWLQNCNSPAGSYTNEIRVNGSGAITLLRFMIHPDYPMLTLTPNNLVF